MEEMREKFSSGSAVQAIKEARKKLSVIERIQSPLPGFWHMPKEDLVSKSAAWRPKSLQLGVYAKKTVRTREW